MDACSETKFFDAMRLSAARLMALPALSELPSAPRLANVPGDALGERVVLRLRGDEEVPTAHVSAYVETATAAVEWVTMMDLAAILDCIPSSALLNTPTSTADVVHGQHSRRSRVILASACRGRGRPLRATDQYLLGSIELVPDEATLTYLEAVRRLRRRQFDHTSRSLIDEACEVIASAEGRLPKTS